MLLSLAMGCQRLDQGLPSQYVRFEGAGRTADAGPVLVLALTNNTSCPVTIPTAETSDLSQVGDGGVVGFVLRGETMKLFRALPDGKREGVGGNLHLTATLLPGTTVRIPVPTALFRDGAGVVVPVSYAWDRGEVVIGTSDLPDEALAWLQRGSPEDWPPLAPEAFHVARRVGPGAPPPPAIDPGCGRSDLGGSVLWIRGQKVISRGRVRLRLENVSPCSIVALPTWGSAMRLAGVGAEATWEVPAAAFTVIPVQGVMTTAGKPAASTSLFSVSLSFPVEYSWDAPVAVGSLGRLSHYWVVAPLSDCVARRLIRMRGLAP